MGGEWGPSQGTALLVLLYEGNNESVTFID